MDGDRVRKTQSAQEEIVDLTDRSMVGSVTRRRFVATGLGLCALPILAACGGAASPTAAPAATAAPKPTAAAAQPTTAAAAATTPAAAAGSTTTAASATPAASGTTTAAQPTAAGAATKPAAAAGATAPSAQPAAAGGQKATIQVRFNGLSTDATNYVKKYVQDWNGQQTIQIQPDFTDWASSFQKISTGVAGGIAPDIFGAGGLWTPVMGSNGAARALDDLLKSYPDWNDWYQAARDDVTWQGKVFAIPYETGVQGNVAHKTSVYQKAGVKDPPATWDEAQNLAKQLVQRNGDTITLAGWDFLANGSLGTQSYEDAIDQAGGHIFNADKSAPTNSTPEGEAALNFLVWFVQNKTMPPGGTPGALPTLDGWATGKIAQGRVAYTDLQYAHQYQPDLYQDTAVSPTLKGVKQAQVLYVDKYMMFSKTKAADAAWEVLKGLIKPDVLIAIYVDANWATPCRKAVEGAKLYDDPRMKVVVDSVKFAVAREAVPQSFDVQPAMSREVEAAVRGTKTVKQALQDMDAAVTKIMKG